MGPGKSINVPKIKFHFEGITMKDLMDLDFIVADVDLSKVLRVFSDIPPWGRRENYLKIMT